VQRGLALAGQLRALPRPRQRGGHGGARLEPLGALERADRLGAAAELSAPRSAEIASRIDARSADRAPIDEPWAHRFRPTCGEAVSAGACSRLSAVPSARPRSPEA